MPHKEPIWKHAFRLTLNHPVLWLFGVFSAVGGVFNVTGIAITNGIHALVLQTWFTIEGSQAIPRITAVVLGLLLALSVVVVISSAAQAIIIHYTAAKHYKSEDPWYGVLRVILRSLVPMTIAVFSFYIVDAALIVGIYKIGDLVIRSIGNNSVWSSVIIPTVVIALSVFIVTLLGILTVFTLNFVVVYRMSLDRAFSSAVDLFFQCPGKAFLNMLIIAGTFISTLFLCLAAYGLLLFVGVWIAHFFVSSQALAQGIFGHTQSGLLITLLVGIIFIANAILSVFMNIEWTLFFLEHVSAVLSPKENSKARMPEIAESVGST
jgi:hypothetical protein